MYISADGCCPQSKSGNDCKSLFHFKIKSFSLLLWLIFEVFYSIVSYDLGGVVTSCRREIEVCHKGSVNVKEIHW